MLLSSGRKLACFSARGASLHGRRSNFTDQRRKLACLNSASKLACCISQGRKLACTMQHGCGSEAQARMIKLGAQARMFQPGAQARMLVSQGRKLAWTMQHGYG